MSHNDNERPEEAVMHKKFSLILFVAMVLMLYIPTAHAATFIVTNLNDSGAGSLRQAVLDANAVGGTDTINFSVPGTITLTSGQIDITGDLVINSATQSITISGNNASRIFNIPSGVSAEIRNLTLTNGNPVGQGGGAILNNGGTLNIQNCTFSANIGREGGAIMSFSGNVTINNSVFSGNSTTASNTGGGAIYNSADTLTINNSTLTGNQSAADGGAIVVGGILNLNNTTIANNTAVRTGGAIVSIASLTINGSTISGNEAGSDGGGINSTLDLSLSNSTVSGNHSATKGGGISSWSAATITNSTFTDNTAPNGANINIVSNTTTVSMSIINNGSCTVESGALTDGGNNVQFNAVGCVGTTGNPQLQPLANNGGLTQTHALGTGSTALDQYTTDCPTTDQRGVTRPQGAACDIGAFEGFGSSTLTVTNLADSGAGSLREIITAATADNTIVFAVSGTITLTSGQLTITKNLTIDGIGQTVTVSGNDASRVFFIDGDVTVEFRHLTISDGYEMSSSGGGIGNNGGTLIIVDATVSHNTAGLGGGVLNTTGGNVTIENSIFSNNTAFNAGGAVNNGGILVIRNSTISGNSSAGGAVHNYGTLAVSHSTFSYNVASQAAGISNVAGTMTIDNSTFFGNDSNQPSSSHVVNGATATITNSTFATTAAEMSGIRTATGGILTLTRTIIYNGECSNSGGSIIDGGDNMVFNATGCPGINANPLLGTLGAYGGATQTLPLLVDSPAIDAYSTNCPPIDQRGVTRPQGAACDIGAFELEPITETSITENEFFAAVEAARSAYPDISRVVVDFVPNGMNLTVATAAEGIGNVIVTMAQQDGFVTFNISSITVNGASAPANYTAIINRDLPNLLVQALDSVLTARFGSGFDVQTMNLTNSALVVDIGS